MSVVQRDSVVEYIKRKQMYLIFDTVTTGQPKNWRAPVTDVNNWPRLVQLAYVFYDSEGKRIAEGDYIIKPNGFKISNWAARIHGINNARATMEGVEVSTVLAEFQTIVERASFLVAHNMTFDGMVMGAEYLRKRMHNCTEGKAKICTMEQTKEFCAVAGMYGYRYPKLSELHYKLFRSSFKTSHNAMVDVKATAECFWKLKRLGKI